MAERWSRECDDEMTNLFGESQIEVEKNEWASNLEQVNRITQGKEPWATGNMEVACMTARRH